MIEDALLFVALLSGALVVAEGTRCLLDAWARRRAARWIDRHITDTRLRRCARALDEEGGL